MPQVAFPDFPSTPNSGPSYSLGAELNARFNALKSGQNLVLQWRGDFDPTFQYTANDLAASGGSMWLCVTANLNSLPAPNNANWRVWRGIGASILAGNAAPTPAIGNDGDLYINSASGDCFSKAAGAWSVFCNIIGKAGAQGIQGAQGPTGATGVAGATGAIGPIGPIGPQGQIGATGATGAIGPTGATGPKGAQGTIGPTGATGAAGPQGQGLTYRGIWQPNTNYNAYDVTTYGGQTYFAPAAFTSGASFASANWSLMAARGVDGAVGATGATGPQGAQGAQGSGQGFVFRGAWAPNTTYNAYDIVTFGGSTYEADHTFTSGAAFLAANWNLLALRGNDGAAGAVGPVGPQGVAGATGAIGATGAQGIQGVAGANGSNGVGVPNGGAAGQILAKNSATNGDTTWIDAPTGGGAGTTAYSATNAMLADGACLTVTHPADTTLKRVPKMLLYNVLGGALLHFEGANGATSTSDDGGHQPTFSGSATISTAQAKFGSSSLRPGAGSANYVSIPQSADLEPGSSDFTIEFWFWLDANNSGYQMLLSKFGGGDYYGLNCYLESNNTIAFICAIGAGGSWTVSLNGGVIPTAQTWHHYAATRQGNTLRLFLDGALIASATNSGAVNATTNGWHIGQYPYVPGGARSLAGYIDEVRILIGQAIYTAAFTPPSAALSLAGGVRRIAALGDATTGVVNVAFSDATGANPDTCTTFTNRLGCTINATAVVTQ